MTRFAGRASRLYFAADTDTDLTGVGAAVGLLIVLLALVVCNLLGHPPPTLLEVLVLLHSLLLLKVLITLAGTVLLLTVGGLSMAHYSNTNYRQDKTVGPDT
jgi:hypothetical protein